MNHLFSHLLILTLLAGPLAAKPQKEETHPVLKKVHTGLSEIAKNLGEGVTIQFDRAKHVRLSFHTRTFLVYGGSKTGRYAKKAHEEEGPDVDGIMVEVRVAEGRYLGAAQTPQTLRRPYWQTFINEYPIAKGRQHLFLNLSTGARPNRKIVSQIHQLLNSLVEDDPKGTPRIVPRR